MKIKRLKALRIKNNLTQKEIAEVLDIKRSTYAGWELGTNIITLRKLVMLSNFYKSSIDYIVGIPRNIVKARHVRTWKPTVRIL